MYFCASATKEEVRSGAEAVRLCLTKELLAFGSEIESWIQTK